MAIDIRATVTCTIGGSAVTLISGSISDDYLQGSGLVKTRGSCEISGLISPAMGDVVTFSYTKEGITRSISRNLLVLSSFADPFRRTTKVELGCRLTYLSDLKEPVKWEAFDDPDNEDYDEEDQRIITVPIHASSLMDQCLTELGITASSNPLTNKFSIAEFDFSAGYVQVLSDLLVSESYFGYLDRDQVLQVISLNQDGGTGPVITSADIVDVGPIGVGQLPGEAVTVSYSSLKLKSPDTSIVIVGPSDEGYEEQVQQTQRINWELDETFGTPQTYFINYKTIDSDTQRVKEYSGASYSTVSTNYRMLNVINPDTGEKQQQEVVESRFTKVYGPTISVCAPFAQAYLEEGFEFNNAEVQLSGTNTYYEYFDNGNRIVTTEETFKTRAEQAGSLGIDLVYTYTVVVNGETITITDPISIDFGLVLTEVIITDSTTAGDATKEVVSRYKLLADTQHGQQSISQLREDVTLPSEAYSVIQDAVYGLVFDGTTVQSKKSGRSNAALPTRPGSAETINQLYSDGGDPNNGWRTESKADLELAFGDEAAQRRIELSMPYAPDDVFTKEEAEFGFGAVYTSYTAKASDAPEKANRYGRVQNNLLLGNRSGMNLQIAPERMPAAPFDPIFVEAEGLTALYRINGTQWAFDSSGIICSTDALYWGVAGRNS